MTKSQTEIRGACRFLDLHIVRVCQFLYITIPVILVLTDIVTQSFDYPLLVAFRLTISAGWYAAVVINRIPMATQAALKTFLTNRGLLLVSRRSEMPCNTIWVSKLIFVTWATVVF